MHKQAIEIKERLLGPDDYEVALSVGHLASIFNYDLAKYDEAEKLYLRSVKIGEATPLSWLSVMGHTSFLSHFVSLCFSWLFPT